MVFKKKKELEEENEEDYDEYGSEEEVEEEEETPSPAVAKKAKIKKRFIAAFQKEQLVIVDNKTESMIDMSTPVGQAHAFAEMLNELDLIKKAVI